MDNLTFYNATPSDNPPCYRLENLPLFETYMFQNCPLAIVLTVEGSTRDFRSEISKHRPCNQVIIQHNKTFRNCSKKLFTAKVACDLYHALTNAFTVALNKGVPRVCILEDDFFMADYNKNLVENIDAFIQEFNPSVYSLGSFFVTPATFFNANKTHVRCVHMNSAHAVIYSAQYMKQFIEYTLTNVNDCHVDQVWYKITPDDLWITVKPIAFQLMVPTENSGEWSSWVDRKLFPLFKLDQTHDNWSMLMWWCIHRNCFLLLIILCSAIILVLTVSIVMYIRLMC